MCRCFCSRQAEQGDALDRPYADRTVTEFLNPQFVNPQATCRERNYCNFMLYMTFRGFNLPSPVDRVIPFAAVPSPIVKGLKLLEPAKEVSSLEDAVKALKGHKSVIVGSVRMGYGHHRIAYSALTWALELGMEPYLLDILAPDCVEAEVVRNMDHTYSKMSRIAAQMGGFVDHMWGKMMLQGDINALRICVGLAERIRPIIAGFPRDVPVISSHPIIGNMAVAAGFKKVINLVFDNWPQYFVLVPGAINLVQSPSYFDKLLDMGCPASNLLMAGHWVSSDICKNAERDCKDRIERCNKDQPRRFLIAVGGAGAQQAFLTELLDGLAELLRSKKIRIYVNCGDHKHIAAAVVAKLKQLNMEWHEVTTSEGTEELVKKEPLSAITEPAGWKAVTVLKFDSHFAAFSCTDRIIRICDVLMTKPSELAFFPVPKLHIRRVGEHEAYSAVRSTELGDGTVECREVSHCLRKVQQIIQPQSPLFKLMNASIIKAAKVETYDGSKVAVELALKS